MATSSTHYSKSFTVSGSNNNYSYRNIDRPMSVDEDFDCVKVEICDIDSTCPNPTSASLTKCKKEIIGPFRKLLCLIGWRPFGADRLKRPSIFLRTINIIYPIFIFILLLFNYAYEIVLCQGKLNFKRDTRTTTTTTLPPIRNDSIPWAPLGPGKIIPQHKHEECGHILTTYILPDIFHCLAFVIGLIYFRITEGEAVYSLMEKVFIIADQSVRMSSTNRAIRRLKIFMLISCLWMLSSVATAAFSNAMNGFSHKIFDGDSFLIVTERGSSRYVFFTVDIICRLVSNSIYLAVVMNYVCHCEMIIFYCKTIRLRLEEKSLLLLESMKRIVDLGASISQLNSAAARMMSIAMIIFLARTILGFILLIANRVFTVQMWIYRSLYVIVWFSILCFCLGQASRVANKCSRFRRIGLSMRVYGYHNASVTELDGFLLFLSQAELRIKLFGLGVRPGKILTIGVAAFLILVVLFQTSFLSDENFYV